MWESGQVGAGSARYNGCAGDSVHDTRADSARNTNDGRRRTPQRGVPTNDTERTTRTAGSTGGFLLLEVLVAVFLLAVSLFVLIEQLSVCVAEARSIQNYTVSDILLANKSYEFRTERATDILDQQGTFDENPGYSWTRKFDATDNEGLWQQTITVYWYERGKEVSDSVVEYRYLPDKTR
jgi:hypothetical protein